MPKKTYTHYQPIKFTSMCPKMNTLFVFNCPLLSYSSRKASAGNIFAARVTGALVPNKAIMSNTT